MALISQRHRVTTLLPIDEASQVGSARRCVAELAAECRLSAEDAARAGLIVTEMASNLLRHARDGRLLLRLLSPSAGEQPSALEMIAIDAGPGMDSVEACLRDGYSTGGTAGTGFGAIRRMADDFDIVSQPGAGTSLLVRVRPRIVPSSGPALRIGLVCLPLRGEDACGDGWALRDEPQGGSLLVVDGLGHGILAEEAAEAARQAFMQLPVMSPADTLQLLHRRLAGTRGGAAAIAQIDRRERTLRYAGIGNIAGTLLQEEGRRGLPSHNGILGSVAGRMQGFEYGWSEGDMLVMHSDGLQTRWTLDGVPGATRRDPSLVAATLYRDFARGRDDVTVAAVSLR